MHKPPTFTCSRTIVSVIIWTTIFLFILIGCTSLFRSAGLSDEQAAQQSADLQKAIAFASSQALQTIQTGLSEGHDLKTIALKTSTSWLWKILTAASAALGVVLNGLLAKWLNTEKKITTAMITGVEKAANSDTKAIIQSEAFATGIQPKLHARVKALT